MFKQRTGRNVRWGLAALVLFSFIGSLSGCGATREAVRWITPGGQNLKKKVYFVPFLDNAELGAARTQEISALFRSYLERAPEILLEPAAEGLAWPRVERSPEFGLLIPEEFIRRASEHRMDALVTGVINPLEVSNRKGGIWPFRKNLRSVDTSLVVQVLDLFTRTLLHSDLQSREFSIKLDDIPLTDEQTWLDEQLRGKIPKLLEQQARAAIRALERAPATGRILTVAGETLTIDRGQAVGLQTGRRLEVLGEATSLPSRGGEAIRLPGVRVGEIEVVEVGTEEARARVLRGGPFAPGQDVRLLP
jgi:hypothetical protein